MYLSTCHLIVDISLIFAACAHVEEMISVVISHSPGVGWMRTFCGFRKAWNMDIGCTVVSQSHFLLSGSHYLGVFCIRRNLSGSLIVPEHTS